LTLLTAFGVRLTGAALGLLSGVKGVVVVVAIRISFKLIDYNTGRNSALQRVR
jgi:hypothetical protein